MKKLFAFVTIFVFLAGMGTAARGQDKKKAPAASEKGKKIVRQNEVKITATVEAVDLPNRMVTLKLPKGNLVELKVDEKVKNLSQVKVGDQVVTKYYESIAVQLLKPGEPGGAAVTQAAGRAAPGEKPAGMVANQVTVTATIEDISPKKTYVTLKGPKGNTVDVKVRDPKNLENVKVGDQVEITYTEALAISVEKAKKK